MGTSLIKAVFFDAAGTLFHVKGSVGEVYLRYAEKYGVQKSVTMIENVNKAFEDSLSQAPPPIFSVEQPEKIKRCERLWWFDIVHAVFYRVGMFEEFDDYFDEVYEAFGTAEPWEVYPEVFRVLKELKQEGFELGVISNFDTRFFEIFRGLRLNPYFDSITVSSLVGALKPAAKIFHHALAQHAIDPQEAVHVGDSFQEDVQGARNINLNSLFLDREGKAGNKNEISLKSLAELPSCISQLS